MGHIYLAQCTALYLSVFVINQMQGKHINLINFPSWYQRICSLNSPDLRHSLTDWQKPRRRTAATPECIRAGSDMSSEDKIDVTSPYFLGSGEQPGNLITHVTLKSAQLRCVGKGYHLVVKSSSEICVCWRNDQQANRIAETPQLGDCKIHDCFMDT